MKAGWKWKKRARFFGLLFFILSILTPPVFADSNDGVSSTGFVKFERTSGGQYLIDTYINGQGPFKFMIDTAASRTSIFERTYKKLNLVETGKISYVSALTTKSLRPKSRIKSLGFAGHMFADRDVIILEDWQDQEDRIDGILGIDVLEKLVLSITHHDKRVQILADYKLKKSKFRRWQKIKFSSNPYAGKHFGFLYTYTMIDRVSIPTLLDTGASFTTISWSSVKGTRLEREKRRLREKWVVQGAVGEFKPTLVVRYKGLIVGGVKLKSQEMLIIDFDKFPINHGGKKPLVIMGIDVFEGRDFVLDIKAGVLYLAPRKEMFEIEVTHKASRLPDK